MRMPYYIKEDGEIWRLLFSLYINHGFSQVIINCVIQLLVCTPLESAMGSIRLMLFWFSAGLMGNLFGATLDDEYACGCEPAMFAMMTAIIGLYIYYWDEMLKDPRQADDPGLWCRKVCGLFICIFILVIGIFFLTSFAQPYNDYTNYYDIAYADTTGFMGGFLFGLPMSWIFF